MKKLFLGILGSVIVALAIMLLAFKPLSKKHELNKTERPATGGIRRTLNGYTQAEARKKVEHCYGTVDNDPEETQIWFNRDVILGMWDLLSKDSTGPYPPDGIRVYFSRAEASVDTPIHQNNMITIVTTYRRDSVNTNAPHNIIPIHQDYFEHVGTPALYNMKDVHGIITHYSDTTYGALLYGTRKGPMRPCDVVYSKHEIPRWKAEKMVQRFHRRFLRTGKINTKAEWFDIGLFQKLVSQLGDVNSGYDGVRVYFARGFERDATKKNNSRNKSMFIFAVTKSASYGDITIHKDQFTCDPIINRLAFFGNNDEDNAQDNGELCPINCNGATLQKGN